MSLLLPGTLAEALAMLAARPDAVPVAGATDLLVRWPARGAEAMGPLLDLSGVGELRCRGLRADALTLGALSTYWDVLQDEAVCTEFPLLAAAARQVGSVQIQTRGTWAGNVINASPAADGVLALMACDAVVELQSATDREEIPLADFYVGYRQTRRRPDQLVTAIRVPRMPREHERFEKIGSRWAQTISKVGLATCRAAGEWHVVVNSMAPTVRRCPSLERALTTGALLPSAAAWLPLIRADLCPIDDVRSTREYREQALARMLHALDLDGRAPG